MKILFIAINAKYPHTNLAVRLLKNETDKIGLVSEFVEHTINSDIVIVLDDLLSRLGDVYAFSCYIWNISYVLKLVTMIKKHDHEAKVLLGGPEISYDADKLFKEYKIVDYAILGEGEKAIKDFSKFLLNRQPIAHCASLVFRSDDKVIQNKIEIDNSFLDSQFPYEDINSLKDRVLYYEASRGCPFSCEFCLSAIGEEYREKPTLIVKRDLKEFIDRDVKIVKFVDRTFNTNKKRALELIRFIMQESKNTCFHLELAPSLLYDDLIKLLKTAKPGLFQLELGIQSTNKQTLTAINRNEDFSEFAPKIKKIIGFRNMHVHVDLIAGLPYEGLIEFSRSFDDVFSLGSDNFQLGFLKLLKGSPLRDKAKKYKISFQKIAPYEFIKTPDLSKKDVVLIKEIEYLLKRYYNSALFLNSVKFLAGKIGSAFNMFVLLNNFIKKNRLSPKDFSEQDLAKILNDFSAENGIDGIKDFLLFESLKKKKRPKLEEYLFNKKRWDFKKKYFKEHSIEKKEGKSLLPVEFNIDILKFIDCGEVKIISHVLIFDYSDFEKGVLIYKPKH